MLLDGTQISVNNGDLARKWLRLQAELLSSLQNSIAAILHPSRNHCREAIDRGRLKPEQLEAQLRLLVNDRPRDGVEHLN